MNRVAWNSGTVKAGKCAVSSNVLFSWSLLLVNKQISEEASQVMSHAQKLCKSLISSGTFTDSNHPAVHSLIRQSRFVLQGDSGIALEFLKSISPRTLSAIQSLVFTEDLLATTPTDPSGGLAYLNTGNWQRQNQSTICSDLPTKFLISQISHFFDQIATDLTNKMRLIKSSAILVNKAYFY